MLSKAKIFATLILGMCMLISNISIAGGSDDVSIMVVPIDEGVLIVIENRTISPLKVARNFEIGGKISLSPLSLSMRGNDGLVRTVQGVINSAVSPGSINIAEYHLYGRRFTWEDLKFYFKIDPGSYELKAIYNSRHKRNCDNAVCSLESSWVPVVVK